MLILCECGGRECCFMNNVLRSEEVDERRRRLAVILTDCNA